GRRAERLKLVNRERRYASMPKLAKSRAAVSNCLRRVTSLPIRSLCCRPLHGHRPRVARDGRIRKRSGDAQAGSDRGSARAAGGGGPTASAATLIRDSATKTTDAKTSRMEVLIDRPGAAGAPGTPIKIAGEADFQAHRAHMLLDLSQLGLPGPPIDAVLDNA